MKLVSTDSAVSALRTLMIGSIDRIETKLGDLWGHFKSEDEEITDEEEEIYELFMELRESILDFGNQQICKVKGTSWIKNKR
jgi:hypothetical protein